MKISFLKNEIFILTILGSFGHNNIYRDRITKNDKIQFRKNIKLSLVKLEDKYKNKVKEKEHLIILDQLKKDLDNKGKNVLKGSSISFGTVQKLLNLYLKYLWCIRLISEPPNCPIDSTILNKIKDYETRWTKMNKKNYCDVIEKIKLVKGNRSIAEWELSEFERKQEIN